MTFVFVRAGTVKPDRSKTVAEWPAEGRLYTVTTDGSVTKHDAILKCSNGLDWTSDNRTFLIADTSDAVIYAYDFDLESGQICKPVTSVLFLYVTSRVQIFKLVTTSVVLQVIPS